ncbi:MAG: response regulator [Verrucomicrobiota bacterium]
MFAPILVAEDSEDDVLLFQLAVNRAALAHTFHFVRDGVEAIEWLEGTGHHSDRSKFPVPSAIITDLKMPRVNGFELLQWVRTQPRYSKLPVIVFSSSNEVRDVARAFSLGATTYFRKSANYFDIIHFLKCLPLSDSSHFKEKNNTARVSFG